VGTTGKLRANGLKMIKIRVFLKGRVGLAHSGPPTSGVPANTTLDFIRDSLFDLFFFEPIKA